MNAQIISALGRDELGEELNLIIDIENTRVVDGKEVVQVYVLDMESSVRCPLKDFKRWKLLQEMSRPFILH